MDIQTIYEGAERLINEIIRRESVAQGHFLTGAMDESLHTEVTSQGGTDTMAGFAAYYAQFVEQGVPAESASMKQFPFLVKYFIQRGLDPVSAKGAAAATIKTWMKEGMSTAASKRFSETGSRQHFIENAFAGNDSKIDEYFNNSFDFAVDEEFQKSKSETV